MVDNNKINPVEEKVKGSGSEASPGAARRRLIVEAPDMTPAVPDLTAAYLDGAALGVRVVVSYFENFLNHGGAAAGIERD